MVELNKYQLYGYSNTSSIVDEVDNMVCYLSGIDDYEEVRSYLYKKFGNVRGKKEFKFAKNVKSIGVIVKKNAIECFGLMNNKSFFKKGWIKPSNLK